MIKIKFIFFLIYFLFLNNFVFGIDIKIKVKIQNQIITNIDIKKEKEYLKFLNPKLTELRGERFDNIAKNSLISFIIKEQELLKFYNINEQDKIIETIEKNFLLNRNIKSKNELLTILKKNNLNYENIRNKLLIEGLWNQYIYSKYFKNVRVDKNQLRKNIIKKSKESRKKYEYDLSEIMIPNDTEENLKSLFLKITESINDVGFENTANIFSISSTSKNGGKIGWVSEIQMSETISKNLINMKIKDISKPIQIANGYLLIKLNNKRELEEIIDIESQLKKLIKNETNRQLNDFSIILFKRLKKNIEINEF